MTAPVDLNAEADALEALAAKATPGVWTEEYAEFHAGRELSGAFNTNDRKFLIALRTRAMPLIRVLASHYDAAMKSWDQSLDRLESLEAERELAKERFVTSLVTPWPTPSEIAARVAEKRKERV